MSLTFERKAEDILKFIDTLRTEQERYHDQKDKMAYAIAALIVAFGIGYFAGDYPPRWVFSNNLVFLGFLSGVSLVWCIAHFILCFQLKCKRIAALDVMAFNYALFDAYTGKDLISFEHKKMNNTRHTFGWMKNVLYTMTLHKRSVEIRDLSFSEGPKFLVDAFTRARRDSTYSAHVECATALLSGLVLIVILSKTFLDP